MNTATLIAARQRKPLYHENAMHRMLPRYLIAAGGVWIAFAAMCAAAPCAEYDWPYREQLQKEIRFWKDIFTTYDDSQYVLHDPDDVTLIYGVVTIDEHMPQREREHRIAVAKYDVIKKLLDIAQKMESGEALGQDERDMLKRFSTQPAPHALKLYAHRVRAQQGIRKRFRQGLERSYAYLPSIRKIFKDYGLPEELACLPHIESSFNPRARSRSGAVGMWQFMPKTAKNYMKINSIIDERYDPCVATKAACALLRLNYKETGDWGLAITAYNHGLNGIKRAAAQHNNNYLEVRKKYTSPTFQFASKNFYPEFLAAVEIMRNPSRYVASFKPDKPPAAVRYVLDKSILLPSLISQCKLNTATMKELNPAYMAKAWSGRVPVPAGYILYLPAGTDIAAVKSYVANQPVQVAAASPSKTPETRKKLPQDKRADQERKLKTEASSETVAAHTPSTVPANNQTKTPSPAATPPARQTDESRVASANVCLATLRQELQPILAVQQQTIRVFGHETMGHYAQWLKVPSSKLFAINNMSAQKTLRQHQTLRLDFSRVPPDLFQQIRLQHHMTTIENLLRRNNLDRLLDYRLREGDTLEKITQEYFNIPSALVLYFNVRSNLNSLRPGSVIRIPVSQARLAANQNA